MAQETLTNERGAAAAPSLLAAAEAVITTRLEISGGQTETLLTGATYTCPPYENPYGESCGGALCVSATWTESGKMVGTLDGSDVTFSGNTTEYGAGIYNAGSVTLYDKLFFTDNFAFCSGAAIDNVSTGNAGDFTTGIFTISGNAVFSGNFSCIDAGAVGNTGTFTMSGEALFTGNSTDGFGGAIDSIGVAVLSGKVTFTENSAGHGGGAICNSYSSDAPDLTGIFTISGESLFSSNHADSGGALNNSGTLTISNNAVFTKNLAEYEGGGVYNDGTIRFSGATVTFSGNTALRKDSRAPYIPMGGAVYNGGTVNFSCSINLATDSDTWVNEGSSYYRKFAVTNWDLTHASAGDSVCIHNFQYFSNCGEYTRMTITVTAAQSLGEYTIATGNLSDLSGKESFTLKMAADAIGQNISVLDQNVWYNGRTYSLSKVGGSQLVLTVSEAAVEKSAKSDVDGNGISDVLFQWTGGNFATGYWMNGTSNWRCANASHPAEWELLGARDMSGDGKADSVFVGNVEVAGVKGAYIGYYQDGVDTDDNWVNIGYLNNAEDITWVNKIGNLTGNPDGKNSIVWHAAELGAAGVWTDGTDNWIAISGYFGKGWELEGTGDFNGDGKDEILWRYEGGLYTSDIDSNFTSLGSCGTEWQVRAVGDFSGDGTDDIVIFHKETGLVAKLENGLAANFEAIGQLDAADWFVVGAGNYNNDPQEDLLVRQYSTGMLGYYVGANISSWVELGRGVNMDWTVIA